MTANKSRAEQLLAELDCHVTIDQRTEAFDHSMSVNKGHTQNRGPQ